MAFTISPNMGLIVPGVGTEYSPTWATDINVSLSAVDSHNHSTGQGVQIQPNGLNINSDLPFQNNNATLLRSVIFNPQPMTLSGASDIGSIYVVGNELYYNDVTGGHMVQLTSNGSVNATSSGISSGTATAAFAAGVLVVNAAPNTPANIQVASVLMGNNSPGTNFLTLAPPSAMPASYDLTLPSLPASTQIVTLDASGNFGTSLQLTQAVNPVGGITMFGGTSAPVGYLLCDGTAVSRTVYSNLFAAIGTANGIGDGSSTFNLPDIRGLFPRGVDAGSGNDPDAASRTAVNGGNSGDNVGSVQSDEFLSHNHQVAFFGSATGAGGDVYAFYNNQSGGGTPIAPVSSNTGGNETRPKNVYLNFIIKT